MTGRLTEAGVIDDRDPVAVEGVGFTGVVTNSQPRWEGETEVSSTGDHARTLAIYLKGGGGVIRIDVKSWYFRKRRVGEFTAFTWNSTGEHPALLGIRLGEIAALVEEPVGERRVP